MFPYIFSPSKVFQPLLQPCKTNFVSCDEKVMRDCQKVLEHVASAVPAGLLLCCIFHSFPRKNTLAIFSLALPLISFQRMMFLSLVFLRCIQTSLTPSFLRGDCWCSGVNSVRLQWSVENRCLLPVSFGKVGEGVWSLYLCNCCFNFPSSAFSSKRNLNLPGGK